MDEDGEEEGVGGGVNIVSLNSLSMLREEEGRMEGRRQERGEVERKG